MKICIESLEDGTYLVGEEVEMGMDESAPEEVAQDKSQGMQPAATVEEALQIASALLNPDKRTEEQQVSAGYASAQPRMGQRPTPQAVFGS